jgi:hypothetical protein
LGQDCTAQYNWLKSALSAVDENDWLIVVGHHPVDEVDVEDFTSLIQERGFSIYLNGHTHTLNQYTIDNAGVYITSGAGSLVNTVDQSHPVTSAKLRGETVVSKGATTHTYQSVYTNKVAGYTRHTFSSDYTTLTTDFVTYTGETVRTIVSDKQGNILSN